MNIVNELRDEIVKIAKSKRLGIRFTEASTSGAGYGKTSKILLFPINDPPWGVRSKSVIKYWKSNQGKNVGTTKNSERYRIYQKVKIFLKRYKPSKKTK